MVVHGGGQGQNQSDVAPVPRHDGHVAFNVHSQRLQVFLHGRGGSSGIGVGLTNNQPVEGFLSGFFTIGEYQFITLPEAANSWKAAQHAVASQLIHGRFVSPGGVAQKPYRWIARKVLELRHQRFALGGLNTNHGDIEGVLDRSANNIESCGGALIADGVAHQQSALLEPVGFFTAGKQRDISAFPGQARSCEATRHTGADNKEFHWSGRRLQRSHHDKNPRIS